VHLSAGLSSQLQQILISLGSLLLTLPPTLQKGCDFPLPSMSQSGLEVPFSGGMPLLRSFAIG
jgi:hypothetical protein